MDLNGRVALVTGAGRRVGRAIALELAAAGCDLVIHFNRSADEAEQVAEAVRAMGRKAALVRGDLVDASVPERLMSETVEQLGSVDVLVNNASIFEKMPLADVDAGVWERYWRINTLAPALLAQAAGMVMLRQERGCIVNLIDIYAERPPRNLAPYLASKGALATLTRALAIEFAPRVTVNGVAPGIAIFPEDTDAEERRRIIERVPLKREGSPEQIARVVRFLAAEGDYITGQILSVDGGRSIQP